TPLETTTDSATQNHSLVDHKAMQPLSPMEDIMKQEDTSSVFPPPSMGPKQRSLKGSKSSSMLRSVTTPHPLAMSSPGHSSLHHFQSNAMYTTPPSSAGFTTSTNGHHAGTMFSGMGIGPLSAPNSPSFPSTTLPSSNGPSSFMAMHGHNSSLYEPLRRNSVPILSVDQAEHKRKISEEKHLHRQGSWSSISPPSSAMMGAVGVPPPVLHHLDAGQIDPATMHYYRTQFSQQHALQQQQQLHLQQHALNQVIPTSGNPSDSFMSSSSGLMASGHSAPSSGSHHHHSSTGAIRSNSAKSFSRSDNFSAHQRTHSKKAHAHRRYENRGLESGANGSGPMTKQEPQDPSLSAPVSSASGSQDQHLAGMSGFLPHPSFHNYSSGSMSQDGHEYGRDFSPPLSPGGTPARPSSALGTSSSMNDDDSFDMMGHSAYGFSNSMYPLDHMDQLNSMVPRFDTIRLDLKSVAPNDIHKQYDDEASPQHSHSSHHPTSTAPSEMMLSNPNGESPRSSPMPQYENFSFTSSISSHFMPVMSNSDAQHSNHSQSHHPFHPHHGHNNSDGSNDLKNLPLMQGTNGGAGPVGGGSSGQGSPSPPLTDEMSSSHLHHPQPYHQSSYSMNSAALPPHPMMSSLTSSSPAPDLTESMYSTSSPSRSK
ncbi:hypothetical protein BGW38_004128, partial [Lunasporangiospora selenospora]